MTDLHFSTKLYSQEAYSILKKASSLEESVALKKKDKRRLWWVPHREVWMNFGTLKRANDGEVLIECPIDACNKKNRHAKNLPARAAKFYASMLTRMLDGWFPDPELTAAETTVLVAEAVKGLDMRMVEALKKLIAGTSPAKLAKKDGESFVNSLVGHPNDPFTTSKNLTLRAEIEKIEGEMKAEVASLEAKHSEKRAKFEQMLSRELLDLKKPFEAKIARLEKMIK